MPQCRAVADQLQGNEEAHGKYQHLAVDYIQVFCKIFDVCTSRTSKIISRLLIGCEALCFLWISLLTLPFGALKIRSDAQAASLIGQCLCLSTPVCWELQKFLESSELVSECMQDHGEEFEPFVEDEVPFDEYCKTMRDVGTWAGHMDLQATSLVTHHNICIHQVLEPLCHKRICSLTRHAVKWSHTNLAEYAGLYTTLLISVDRPFDYPVFHKWVPNSLSYLNCCKNHVFS